MSQFLPWLSLVAVLASLGVSALSYVRAGRWKDGDDAARLIARVGDIEHEVVELKAKMENVATKADVERLTAKVEGVETQIRTIDRGVERIEGFLMKERA